MTTYFVSELGKNTAAGTQETPLATIGRALALAKTGDTVMLRGGTWRERVTMVTPGVTLSALPVTGGYEPVVLDGDNYRLPDGASSPGGVYSFGTWFPNNFQAMITATASQITVAGFTIQNSKGRGIEAEGHISAHTTDVTFRHIRSLHTRTSTIGTKYVDNVLVEDCYAEDGSNYAPFIRPTATNQPHNHPAGVSFQVGKNITVRRLVSKGHWGEGLMLSCIDGFLVEGCWVADMMSGLYYGHRVRNGVFRGNVGWYSDANAFAPMRLGGAGNGLSYNNEDWRDDWGDRATYATTLVCENIETYNNIFIGCAPAISILGGNTGVANQGILPFKNIRHLNNTIVRPRDIGLRVGSQSKITKVQFINNIVQLGNFPGSTQTFFPNTNIAQITRHHNAWSMPPETNAGGAGDVVGDLRLENPNAMVDGLVGPVLGNYAPRANSPLRSAGADIASFSTDYHGNARTPGAWSMGAVQVAEPPVPEVRAMSGWRAGVRVGVRAGVG